jgi:hypothetical protein
MLANGSELDGKRLLSPRAVELMSSNHVGEMFGGQLGRPTGMGFGLTVEVVSDAVRAGTFRSEGRAPTRSPRAGARTTRPAT